MSLHPQTDFTIPADTVRIAQAAFPKKNIYIRMRDELGLMYHDADLASLFSQRGQPALAPARKRVNYDYAVCRRINRSTSR